jgi:uncharacterized membrane protein
MNINAYITPVLVAAIFFSLSLVAAKRVFNKPSESQKLFISWLYRLSVAFVTCFVLIIVDSHFLQLGW